jgi:hypothetical protein
MIINHSKVIIEYERPLFYPLSDDNETLDMPLAIVTIEIYAGL